MFLKLLLLFTAIPIIELSLLIKVGSYIGTLNTIILVLLTAVVGAYMVRLEGLGVLYRLQRSLLEGRFPADELISGLMILVAGAFLLTPGFFTDTLGFLMVLPASRNYIRRLIKGYFRKRISSMYIHK
jgi:UPF0716 protein FxsA